MISRYQLVLTRIDRHTKNIVRGFIRIHHTGPSIPNGVTQIILLFYFVQKTTEKPIPLRVLFIGHRDHPFHTHAHPLLNRYFQGKRHSIPVQDENTMGYNLPPKRYLKTVHGGHQMYDLRIWDCGFPNSFRIFTGFPTLMMREIEAAILTFDVSDINALDELKRYIDDVRKALSSDWDWASTEEVPILLIAMHCDETSNDEGEHFTDSMIDQFCKEYGIQKWFRIKSNADDASIKGPLVYAVDQMVARREKLNLPPFGTRSIVNNRQRKASPARYYMSYILIALVISPVICAMISAQLLQVF